MGWRDRQNCFSLVSLRKPVLRNRQQAVSLMVISQQRSVSVLCYINKDSALQSKNSGRDIKMSCRWPMCSVLKTKVLQVTHYIRPPSIKRDNESKLHIVHVRWWWEASKNKRPLEQAKWRNSGFYFRVVSYPILLGRKTGSINKVRSLLQELPLIFCSFTSI